MSLSASPLYAALIALLFCALSVRTLLLRRKYQVALGTGKNVLLQKAIRAHGNCAEYAPLGILLLVLVDLLWANSLLVHVLGLSLLLGRALHAFGVSQAEENYVFRVSGMALTFTSVIGSSIALIAALVLRQGL